MDVRLFQTVDGGEIEIVNGVFTMSDGLEAAAYLSLFGGNERDNGLQATASLQWWGNRGVLDAAQQYRSETQSLLRDIPATTGNLQRIRQAADRDLAWMADAFATRMSTLATMPALNRIEITVGVEIDGAVYIFTFNQQWGAPKQ
jgi:hypothetical protein